LLPAEHFGVEFSLKNVHCGKSFIFSAKIGILAEISKSFWPKVAEISKSFWPKVAEISKSLGSVGAARAEC
jgi:hypothetical protein